MSNVPVSVGQGRDRDYSSTFLRNASKEAGPASGICVLNNASPLYAMPTNDLESVGCVLACHAFAGKVAWMH